MSDVMYEKFNGMFDMAGLLSDLANVNTGEFVEVPYDTYEVSVTKIELGETGEKSKTPGMPMAKIWFNIIAGEFKGQMIFCNQMLTSAFGIHKCRELLESFESGVPVSFENFPQFAKVMKDVFDAIDGIGQYELVYGQNKKGYATYTITKRYQ